MSQHPNLKRGILLLNQSRFPDAEKEFKKVLADEPTEALAYALIGECLIQQNKGEEALEMAKKSLYYDAANPYHHSVLAKAYMTLNKLKEAREAIDEAIQIEPYDAHYYFLRGNIAYAQRDWEFTLINAEKALEVDPEYINAINLRSMALVNLNRKDEAANTADYALHKAPENPYAHANKGWAELERNNNKEAQKHFKEALRLDPMNDMARMGLKESIKAENFLYRQILNYFLWIGKMSSRNQWAFIIGVYILYQGILWANANFPALAPILQPLIVFYIIFAFSTWIAMPVSNLFLRLHPLGKFALTEDERLASTLVGALLAGCIVFFLGYAITGSEYFMLWGGYCGFMALPVGGLFGASKGSKGRRVLTIMAAAIGVIGFIGVLTLADTLITVALLGIFAFGWVSNSFSIRS